jgi:hypothetical protein
MRQPEYEMRRNKGEQIDLVNAPNVKDNLAQTPYTRSGELNPQVVGQIETAKSVPPAPVTPTKAPDIITGANYTDISKTAAQNDIAGASGNHDADKKFAADRLVKIQTDAEAARNTAPYTNKLGNTLVNVNKEGALGGPGFAFNTRAGYSSLLNFVARIIQPTDPDTGKQVTFSDADTERDLAKKIGIMQGDARARSANQNSYSALNDFTSITPNPEMAPKAAADILAQIMTDQKKARDIESHALQYRRDAVGGGFNNHARAFEQEKGHRQEDYVRQQEQLKNMILSSLDPKNKNKQSAFKMLSSGEIPIEQAQEALKAKGYDPRLVGYFYSRGVQ